MTHTHICGECFCAYCGDCLYCFGEDTCWGDNDCQGNEPHGFCRTQYTALDNMVRAWYNR